MLIKNAGVFTQDGKFVKENIRIENGLFSCIGDCNEDGKIIDAEGLLAIPGLVDIHFHGAVGCDLCDADIEGLKAILDYELACGIMAVCPATMTFPEKKLSEVIDRVRNVQDYDRGADIVGINLEGPFINPKKAGAQNTSYISEGDSGMLRRLLERGRGLIKLVDVAPEFDSNMCLIDEFKNEVRFSLAHTEADYCIAKEAFRRGAGQLTHAFNAMNETLHRSPGPVLAACEEGAYAELIADGVHIHDAVIRMAFKLFGDKIILISDSCMAAGLEDGLYSLGGQDVTVEGAKCTLTDKPDTIAGSNTDLFGCLKHAVTKAQIPMDKAIKAATINPARAIGIDDKYGSIALNLAGNIILMDEDFNIKYIIKDGIIRKHIS